VPLDWAMTQNNLGNALTALGERDGVAARLEDAVAAYRAALKEWTRERVPLDWAAAQNNLGNALMRLGEREGVVARLEDAVTAYGAALEERTRERVPLDWAMTQNNLGNALRVLGERTVGQQGVEHWQAAIAAWRSAQLVRTRDQEPEQWAAVQNAIGHQLVLIGERTNDLASLEAAVPILREAVAVVSQRPATRNAAETYASLCQALFGIGSRKKVRAELLEARQFCDRAMDGLEAAGGDTAETAGNLNRIADALKDLP